jgi:hypothetical protein
VKALRSALLIVATACGGGGARAAALDSGPPEAGVIDEDDASFAAPTPGPQDAASDDSAFDAKPPVSTITLHGDAEAGLTQGDGALTTRCGDGLRNANTEACDPGANPAQGTSESAETCTSDCEVRSANVIEDSESHVRLGEGPHPIALGARGGALVYLVEQGDEVALQVAFLDAHGFQHDLAQTLVVSSYTALDPVVGALPDGKVAVAWTEAGSSSGGPDVQAVTVDAGGTVHQQFTVAGNGPQHNVDLLVLHDRVVLSWSSGFSDVYAQVLDFELAPVGAPVAVAQTPELEDTATLARFGAEQWVMTWRQSDPAGERIGVYLEGAQGEQGTQWLSDAAALGPASERPSIAQHGAGIAVVHSVPAEPESRHRLRLLHLQSTEPDESLVELDVRADGATSQARPSAAATSEGVFLAWEEQPADDTQASEIVWTRLVESSSVPDLRERIRLATPAQRLQATPFLSVSDIALSALWAERATSAGPSTLHRVSWPLPFTPRAHLPTDRSL